MPNKPKGNVEAMLCQETAILTIGQLPYLYKYRAVSLVSLVRDRALRRVTNLSKDAWRQVCLFEELDSLLACHDANLLGVGLLE